MLQNCFYGERKMSGLGFLRVGVWQNILRVLMRGYVGNKKGEGFILGGLYVIGPECQVSLQFLLFCLNLYFFLFETDQE